MRNYSKLHSKSFDYLFKYHFNERLLGVKYHSNECQALLDYYDNLHHVFVFICFSGKRNYIVMVIIYLRSEE